MDDQTLVDRIRSGDEGATRVLVGRYHGPLFGLCYRMLRHRQDAEDVVQETFLRALGGLRRFDAGRPLRPWLLGIAANRCRTALGRRGRRPIPLDDPDGPIDPQARPADADDLAAELDRALARLRPDYQLVFVLFHDQQLSYDEIARTIDRPIGTVRIWLHRARAELAATLARRGIRC